MNCHSEIIKLPNKVKESYVVSLINDLTSLGINFEYVVLHPIPNPPAPDPGSRSYLERVPAEIISEVKSILG